MFISIDGPHVGKSSLCEPILRALPQWFGIEEATRHYVEYIDTVPTFIAWHETKAIGFVSIKRHYPRSAEVYVMAVLPQFHRHGAGRALIAASEQWLTQEAVEFVHVKTLSPSHPDEGYRKNARFLRKSRLYPARRISDTLG